MPADTKGSASRDNDNLQRPEPSASRRASVSRRWLSFESAWLYIRRTSPGGLAPSCTGEATPQV